MKRIQVPAVMVTGLYNREGGERPYRPSYNREGGDRPYRPRFNANNEGGERPQRSYGDAFLWRPSPTSFLQSWRWRSSVSSRFNNNNEGGERPQRPYNREGGSYDRPQRPFTTVKVVLMTVLNVPVFQ